MSNIYSADAGHNAYPDTGASGYKQEDVLTKQVVAEISKKLASIGYTLVDCTPYGQTFPNVTASLSYRCSVANSSGSIFHMCVHFNSGGGHGVEVFAISAGARDIAQRICNEITKLGYTNRGVKDGSDLYVVKNTRMPCVLIECSFVDSADDMNRYNPSDLANAIVKAVTGIDTSTTVVDNKQYRVITGAFGNKQDAINFSEKLKSQGTTAYVVDASILK